MSGRCGTSLFEQCRDRFSQLVVHVIGKGAMGLPRGVPVGSGNDEVRIIGGGKIDELFPFGFVGVERNEVGKLFLGGIFTHTAENHRAHEGGSVL